MHFPEGKRNKNMIFERFARGKLRRRRKNREKVKNLLKKSCFFCAPQAKNFGVKKLIFYKKAPHYKKAPPIMYPRLNRGGAFL